MNIMNKEARRKAIRSLRTAGFILFPCRGKVPSRKGVNWRETKLAQYTEEELACENYAVAFKKDQMAIDIDPRNFGAVRPDGQIIPRFLTGTSGQRVPNPEAEGLPLDNPIKRLLEDAGIGAEVFKPTFRVKTGGGGHHIYLSVSVPEGMEIADMDAYPGINFQRHGKYTVGPGSIHPDTKKPYEIAGGDPSQLAAAPETLLRIILRPIAKGFDSVGTRAYKDDAATQERFVDYLRGARPSIEGLGGNANAFKVAARGRDFALPPETTWRLMTDGEWNTKCLPPWSASELHGIVEHAYRYARGAVGNSHPEADFSDIPLPAQTSALDSFAQNQKATAAPTVRLSCISGQELWTKEYPPARCLIDEYLPEEACGFIAGVSGARKTWFEIELAFGVVTGQPVLGRFKVSRPGPVVMVMGEDSLRNVRERMVMMAQGKGLKPIDLKELHWVVSTGVLSDTKREGLAEICTQYRPRLIILDPFVRMHASDENSAQEIQPILSYVRDLQRRFGVSILITHHLMKNRDGRPGRTMEQMRGSGDLGAWADTVFLLDRSGEDPEGLTRVTIAKQRDMPERSPLMFGLEVNDGAARLVVHDGELSDLRVEALTGQILARLRNKPGGILKSDLLDALIGSNTNRRKALDCLIASKEVRVVMEKRKASDGKAHPQSVVYQSDRTSAQPVGQESATVVPISDSTSALPFRGAGVEDGLRELMGNRRRGLDELGLEDQSSIAQ